MQKLFFLYLILITWGTNYVSAQSNITIKGSLQDSILRPVKRANVILIYKNDTLLTTSNDTGVFQFSNVKLKSFYLQVNALGYKNYLNFYNHYDEKTPIIIKLISYEIHLDSIIIKAKIRPVIFKKDTIEYNTAAYNTDDNVINLLTQLPGIEIDKDGNLTEGGLPVNKLRVNGVDFFTGNVKEFISQLPARIFDKLQIVDDYGDGANFSGIRNGASKKLLNLVTKPGMDHGIFGVIKIDAGTEKLYGLASNENVWKGAKQIGVSVDLNTQKDAIGINNKSNAGFTYNNSITPHLSINNSYNFYQSRLSSESNSFEDAINTLGTVNTRINSNNTNKIYNHQFNSKITYKPNESEFIKSNINLALDPNISNSGVLSQQSGLIKQDLVTQSELSNSNLEAQGLIDFGKRFKKKGRLIMVNLKYSYSASHSTQQNYNTITYYDSLANPAKDSIVNQSIFNTNHTQIGSLAFNYFEPISTHSRININYNVSLNHQNNQVVTNLNLVPSGTIKIDSLSQSFTTSLLAQSAGINLQHIYKKVNILYGVNFQKSELSENYIGQVPINNNTTNFFPSLSLHYAQSPNSDYGFNYSGNSMAPTSEQLQTVKNVGNLQTIIIGNPDLKPSFNHSLKFSYRHTGLETGQILFLNASGGFIQNQIINTSILVKDTLKSLKQINSYINVNGSYNLNADYNWSLPFKLYNKPFKISLNGSINYNYGLVYTDSIKSQNINKFYTQTVHLSSFIKIFSFDAALQYQKNFNLYSTGNGLATSFQIWNFTSRCSVRISNNLNFNTDVNKRINQGYNNIGTDNPFIMNAALELMLFKKRNINIQLQAFDIFNEANSVNQLVTGNTVTNTQYNYVSRYLIVSFSVPIQKFGKADK